MLTDRRENEVVFVSGGRLIRHTIQNGESLELRSGDQRVLVRDVAVLDNDQYSGVIYSIEPSNVAEINGLQVGATVEFGEKHVFGIVGT